MAKVTKRTVAATPAQAAANTVSKATGKANKTVSQAAAASLPQPAKGKGKQPAAQPATAPVVAPVATTAPAVVAPVKAPAQYGVARAKGLPWCLKMQLTFAALKALGATSPTTAVGSNAVQLHTGGVVSARYARHYVYHGAAASYGNNPLTGVATLPTVKGHALYITPAGLAMLANPPATVAPVVAAQPAPVATPAPVAPVATLPKGKKPSKK